MDQNLAAEFKIVFPLYQYDFVLKMDEGTNEGSCEISTNVLLHNFGPRPLAIVRMELNVMADEGNIPYNYNTETGPWPIILKPDSIKNEVAEFFIPSQRMESPEIVAAYTMY